MLDLTKIKEFSMNYIVKSENAGYGYIQVDNSIVVSPDKQTVKVTLKSEKNREGIDPFDIVLTKKDDRYWVKSDYFEDEGSSSHPVVVYEEADAFILVFQSGDEAMYLHAYYD